MKRHRISPGDVYALLTEGGTGYFQCGSILNEGVALIRLLPGLFAHKPLIDELCDQSSLSWLIFPLSLYLSRGDVQFVGLCQPPIAPKMMIQQKLDSSMYIVTYVDGSMHYAKSTTVTLTEEEAQKLPDYRMPNRPFLQLTMLRLNGIDPEHRSEQTQSPGVVSHFLYFEEKVDATKLITSLEQSIEQIRVDLREFDVKPRFSVIVNDSHAPLEPSRLSEILFEAAVRFKGEYDGYEVADVS